MCHHDQAKFASGWVMAKIYVSFETATVQIPKKETSRSAILTWCMVPFLPTRKAGDAPEKIATKRRGGRVPTCTN